HHRAAPPVSQHIGFDGRTHDVDDGLVGRDLEALGLYVLRGRRQLRAAPEQERGNQHSPHGNLRPTGSCSMAPRRSPCRPSREPCSPLAPTGPWFFRRVSPPVFPAPSRAAASRAVLSRPLSAAPPSGAVPAFPALSRPERPALPLQTPSMLPLSPTATPVPSIRT